MAHSGEMVFTGVYMRSVLSQSGELASVSRFETKYLNDLILNLSLKLRKFQLYFVSNSNEIYFFLILPHFRRCYLCRLCRKSSSS